MDIDVNFDFTTDTPGYWPAMKVDPDIYSPTLRKYHQQLWSKKLPNGEDFNLVMGNRPEYDYLYWKNMRFGSDSIINMYTHHKNGFIKSLLTDVKKKIPEFDKVNEYYIRKSYTIGGSIIFPKHANSMNICRGTNKQIKDRFDLTLECIRRFYNNEKNLLDTVLNSDKEFYELFGNFKNYVDFFFLQDLVTDDYQNIKFFLPFDNFNRNPYPLSVGEWQALYDNQMEFLNKRNNRISIMELK